MEKSVKGLPDLPASILNQGQITIRVSTPEKRDKVQRMMQLAGTNSVGEAAWAAFEFFLEHAKPKGTK